LIKDIQCIIDSDKYNNVKLYTLQDIADWQINLENKNPTVDLPALQRGYIWNPFQIEGLWDSIIRRLPIGSFLITKFDEELTSYSKSQNNQQPEYLLLDGQQRATSIALGAASFNPWNDETKEYDKALWIDLHKPAKEFTDRAFMFRLLTKSHPWGYQFGRRDKLPSGERNKALDKYQAAIIKHLGRTEEQGLPEEKYQYPNLSVSYTWPWDSYCPLPFNFLLDSVKSGGDNWKGAFIDKLDSVKYWNKIDMPTKNDPEVCWKAKLKELLSNEQNSDAKYYEYQQRLEILVNSLKEIMEKTCIPAIIICPKNEINTKLMENIPEDVNIITDTIEATFVRINSAGTPLSGEELIYSTFKSICPRLKSVVERVAEDSFIRPARLVALVARLVNSLIDEKSNKNFIQEMTVRRFRSLVRNNNAYSNKLREFIKSDAPNLFRKATEILTWPVHQKDTSTCDITAVDSAEINYRLGPLLAENLVRNHPDIYFLFLRWLYEKLEENPDYFPKDDNKHIIGAITSIMFFCFDKNRFLRRLWSQIYDNLSENKWWEKGTICTSQTLLGEERKLVMMPLLTPAQVKTKLKDIYNYLTVFDTDNKDEVNKRFSSWNCYHNLMNIDVKNNNDEFIDRCREIFYPEGLDDNIIKDENFIHLNKAWYEFWHLIRYEKRLVLYSQRQWMQKFYRSYNPSIHDHSKDIDIPYDWDHILPDYYIKYNSGIFHIWHDSWPYTIANLRAWPMELNRSDGNSPPGVKLNEKPASRRWQDIFKSDNDIRISSVCQEGWKYWQNVKGELQDIKNNLREHSEVGKNLLKALMIRLYFLYKNWYETLEIDKIF
jgi:hypothetical protein